MYRIRKVFNNSVVLADDEGGTDYVFLGKGIGWGRHLGDAVDLDRVDRRFSASDTRSSEQIGAYLASIPRDDITLTEYVIEQARKVLGDYVGERTLLPLADHLSVALHRAQQSEAIEYPWRWEIEAIYPREVQFARTVIEFITSERGVTLPAGEALPIALHFVNAQFGSGEMSRTMDITKFIGSLLNELQSTFDLSIDMESVEVSRFVTHLRFLIVRKLGSEQVVPIDSSVREALSRSNAAAVEIAHHVAELLEQRFGWRISADEEIYVALHAANLIRAGKASSAPGGDQR